MSTNKIIGIFLLVLGVLAFSYQGVMHLRTREKVIDAGPVQVTAERTHNIPLAPILGGLAIVAGIVVLARSSRRA